MEVKYEINTDAAGVAASAGSLLIWKSILPTFLRRLQQWQQQKQHLLQQLLFCIHVSFSFFILIFDLNLLKEVASCYKRHRESMGG